MPQTVPRLCHETIGLAFPVKLWQASQSLFMVEYGEQICYSLTYEEAAREYGRSIMHALACDGMIEEES